MSKLSHAGFLLGTNLISILFMSPLHTLPYKVCVYHCIHTYLGLRILIWYVVVDSPLGLGAYRGTCLKLAVLNWKYKGSANIGKKAPWVLVVTDTLIWNKCLLIESPLLLLILRKKLPGVWWLQTCSLKSNLFYLRAHRFCLFWEKSTLGFVGYRHTHLIPIYFN